MSKVYQDIVIHLLSAVLAGGLIGLERSFRLAQTLSGLEQVLEFRLSPTGD
jgi:uncharacterized membrane protein YhiD involved in acid resistance